MFRSRASRSLASVVVLLPILIFAPAQPSSSHETEHHAVTSDLLDVVQSMRDDMDDLLGGMDAMRVGPEFDVDGRWRSDPIDAGLDTECTGDLPASMLEAIERTEELWHLDINQRGHSLFIERMRSERYPPGHPESGYFRDAIDVSFTGVLSGNQVRYEYTVEREGAQIRVTGEVTLLSAQSGIVTERIEGIVHNGQEVTVTCTDEIKARGY